MTQLSQWASRQAQPAPPKKTLWGSKIPPSDATVEFLKHYTRLSKTKTSSKTALELYRAVVRAETAKNLILRLPKMRANQAVRDYLGQLQFLTFAASNWIRRFVEDRYDLSEWSMVLEKSEANKLTLAILDGVADLFAKVEAEAGESKTNKIAFGAFEVDWKKEDLANAVLAEKNNQAIVQKLDKMFASAKSGAFSEVKRATRIKFINAMDELEDIQGHIPPEQLAVIEAVRAWMQLEKMDEPWRSRGIITLGPFGIQAKLAVGLRFNAEITEFTLTQPTELVLRYSKAVGGDGRVWGKLSPLSPVTVRKNDPVADLIRIPPAAKFFAFACPIITSQLEVELDSKTPVDAFLLWGGFLYFDEHKALIQANGLWVGCNVQLSAARKLPAAVSAALEEQNRFCDVTLDSLSALGAKRFAWLLPGEFSDVISNGHGAWCYQYEDAEVNNYFEIASADSVLGKTKSANLELD